MPDQTRTTRYYRNPLTKELIRWDGPLHIDPPLRRSEGWAELDQSAWEVLRRKEERDG